MLRLTILIIVFATIFAIGEAETQQFLENLPKCALKDQACFRKLYEHIVQSIGEKGIPELEIPPVDPIELKNISISLLGLIDITLVKGFATGIRTCVFDKFMFNLTKESGHQENTCSLKIESKYKLRSHSPLVESFFGSGSIHGDGNLKASINSVHLKFDFPVYAQKRSNGEIYMNCDYKKIIYDYQVKGGAKFFADNIYMSDREVSQEIIPFMNENWMFVMKTFGKPFIDKATEIYFDFAGKFFNVVPARYYIIDDLTPFARPWK